jgi:VCBS repeat protein
VVAAAEGACNFADVDGDGKADAIAVEDTGVWVRTSTGSAFAAAMNWSHEPYWGGRSTQFADVDGDGKADAIAVTNSGVYVCLSTGSDFAPWTGVSWSNNEPLFGDISTQFADVTGDGKADAISVNRAGIWVNARPALASRTISKTHGCARARRPASTRRGAFTLLNSPSSPVNPRETVARPTPSSSLTRAWLWRCPKAGRSDRPPTGRACRSTDPRVLRSGDARRADCS